MKTEFPNISYLSETQKNNFQFLIKQATRYEYMHTSGITAHNNTEFLWWKNYKVSCV